MTAVAFLTPSREASRLIFPNSSELIDMLKYSGFALLKFAIKRLSVDIYVSTKDCSLLLSEIGEICLYKSV